MSAIGIVNAVSNYARTFLDFHKMLSLTIMRICTTYAHAHCSIYMTYATVLAASEHIGFIYLARFHYIFSRGIYDSTHLTCDDVLSTIEI